MPAINTTTFIPPSAKKYARFAASGCATMILGAVALFFVLVVYLVLKFAGPHATVCVNTNAMALLLWTLLFAFIFTVWIVASGRKKSILYLRRFRSNSANQAVSEAMYSSLRGVARVVVLDDGEFAAIKIPLRERVATIVSAVPVVLMMGFVLGLGSGVDGSVVVRDQGLNFEATGLIMVTSVPGTGSGSDHTNYRASPLLLSFPGAIGLWLILLVLSIVLIRSVFGGWEARQRIRQPVDLARAAKRVWLSSRWLTAPRVLGSLATVLRVDDSLWQDTVKAIARDADAVVLDISDLSEAIQWELQFCAEECEGRLLLTMNSSMTDPLESRGQTIPVIADAFGDSTELKWPILQYDLTKEDDALRFHRSLCNVVDAC